MRHSHDKLRLQLLAQPSTRPTRHSTTDPLCHVVGRHPSTVPKLRVRHGRGPSRLGGCGTAHTRRMGPASLTQAARTPAASLPTHFAATGAPKAHTSRRDASPGRPHHRANCIGLTAHRHPPTAPPPTRQRLAPRPAHSPSRRQAHRHASTTTCAARSLSLTHSHARQKHPPKAPRRAAQPVCLRSCTSPAWPVRPPATITRSKPCRSNASWSQWHDGRSHSRAPSHAEANYTHC